MCAMGRGFQLKQPIMPTDDSPIPQTVIAPKNNRVNGIWVTPASLGKLIWYVIRLLSATLKIREVGFCEADMGNKPRIYALWHGRMFFPLYCRRRRGINVLVSEHRDGEIIAATLKMAGYGLVRGSTSHGGIRALARMARLAKKGYTTAFTPDGPRGPRMKVQPGIIYLAGKTGLPIVPLSGGATRKIHLSSWDQFLFPRPFSRAVLTVGEPIYIRDNTDISINVNCELLEKELNRITILADRLTGQK